MLETRGGFERCARLQQRGSKRECDGRIGPGAPHVRLQQCVARHGYVPTQSVDVRQCDRDGDVGRQQLTHPRESIDRVAKLADFERYLPRFEPPLQRVSHA